MRSCAADFTGPFSVPPYDDSNVWTRVSEQRTAPSEGSVFSASFLTSHKNSLRTYWKKSWPFLLTRATWEWKWKKGWSGASGEVNQEPILLTRRVVLVAVREERASRDFSHVKWPGFMSKVWKSIWEHWRKWKGKEEGISLFQKLRQNREEV